MKNYKIFTTFFKNGLKLFFIGEKSWYNAYIKSKEAD